MQKSSPTSSEQQRNAQQIEKHQIKTKEEYILELMEKRGFVKIRVSIEFMLENQKQKKQKLVLAPLNYTLLQLQQELRKSYKLRPEEGLFIFINNHKVIEFRTPLKELAKKYLTTDERGNSYIQITVTTVEKFG